MTNVYSGVCSKVICKYAIHAPPTVYQSFAWYDNTHGSGVGRKVMETFESGNGARTIYGFV